MTVMVPCECCGLDRVPFTNDGGRSTLWCDRDDAMVCETCRVECHSDDVKLPHLCTLRIRRTRCHTCETIYNVNDLLLLAFERKVPVTTCPTSGDKGVPHDPDDDRTIVINPHDLRVLTIWAANYAQEHKLNAALAPTLRRLRRQLPDVPLTLFDEVSQLRDAGFNATMHEGDSGEQIFPPQGPPQNQAD